MNGKITTIKNPEEPKAEPRKFTFDFSYWSHDGFKELDDGYMSPTDSKYGDQVSRSHDFSNGYMY
jgi:kinesin family protein 1